MSTPVPDVGMSPVSAVGLVASREITTRVKSKAFRVATVVMLLLIVVGIVLLKLFSGGGGADATVGYTPATAAFSAPLKASGQAVGEKIDDHPGRRRGRPGARSSPTARSTRC